MSHNSAMILDANAFIEPKNRFYAFDICPAVLATARLLQSNGEWLRTL